MTHESWAQYFCIDALVQRQYFWDNMSTRGDMYSDQEPSWFHCQKVTAQILHRAVHGFASRSEAQACLNLFSDQSVVSTDCQHPRVFVWKCARYKHLNVVNILKRTPQTRQGVKLKWPKNLELTLAITWKLSYDVWIQKSCVTIGQLTLLAENKQTMRN